MTKEDLENLSALNRELERDIIDELKRIIMDRVLESILEYAKLNEFVNSIDDPLIRQAVLHHYADGLTWRQTATRIGGGNTADGIRLKVDRYLHTQNRQKIKDE